MQKRFVTLDKIIKEFKIETMYLPKDASQIQITRSDVTRPGLQLAGYFDHFEAQRLQVVGRAEFDYLGSLPEDKRHVAICEFLSHSPVCIIITHGNRPSEAVIDLVRSYGVPLLCTKTDTSPFISALIAYLAVELAPMITRHGVFVEVYGEGILIIGESGIGKSETAVELLKRGHRLIADDAVEIRRVSAITLTGSAPELIRHYIELRGIGIVDVCRIFGMGAVKDVEKIDMIIKLENWVEGKTYSRIGDEEEYTNILGIDIPTTPIPVQPGRTLAVVIEIAAMERRQRLMGYNTAKEFAARLDAQAVAYGDEQ